MIRDIIFAELEKFLLKLGFINWSTTGSHKIFKYPSSGTLIILPGYEPKAYVHPVHLVAIRRILIEHGLINRGALDNFLAKVAS